VSYESLTDGVIDELAQAALDLPTAHSEIHIQHMGGAVSRGSADSGAFSQRRAGFFVNLIGMTVWEEEFPALRDRVRSLQQRIESQGLPQRLPNFSNQDDGDVLGQVGAAAATRLAALRRRYDPAGRFVVR